MAKSTAFDGPLQAFVRNVSARKNFTDSNLWHIDRYIAYLFNASLAAQSYSHDFSVDIRQFVIAIIPEGSQVFL